MEACKVEMILCHHQDTPMNCQHLVNLDLTIHFKVHSYSNLVREKVLVGQVPIHHLMHITINLTKEWETVSIMVISQGLVEETKAQLTEPILKLDQLRT